MGERFFIAYLPDHAENHREGPGACYDRRRQPNQMTEQAIVPALRRMGPLLQRTRPTGRSEHDQPIIKWEPAPVQTQGGSRFGRPPVWASRWSNHSALATTPEHDPLPTAEEDPGLSPDLEGDDPTFLENADGTTVDSNNIPEEMTDLERQAMAVFKRACEKC
jgi:hypothetical protein